MTPQIIFSIISVVVLLTTTQLVKKFANEFYTKISKFIPIIIGVISIIAQGVFNFASAGSIDGVEVISFIDKIDFETKKEEKPSTSFDENQQAAIDAALANAGLGQEDVTDIGCTLDEATQQYTVTFTFQDIKNICTVDAATFTVLSSIQG